MEALIARHHYAALEHSVYLNQASLGLIPQGSVESMTRFLEEVAQHGNVRMSDEAEARVLDDLRAAAASLLDAPEQSIAITGGASEGLGQLAAALATPDGEVVLVSSDFPSVTYPWLAAHDRLGTSIRWVEDSADSDLTTELIEAISAATSVMSFSAVQYATGTAVDVAAVVRAAHAVGAKVVVDVTQLAGAGPVSMREWSADALVCSGYKWLSAHGGVALLAVSQELAGLTPHVVGWKGTNEPFSFDASRLALAEDARRYELSTMSYCSAVGLSSSLALLADAGVEALAAHSRSLAVELVETVAHLGWAPYRAPGTVGASSHIVSLRHSALDPAMVQGALAEDHQVNVSSRGNAIRVSLHGYNDSSDVNRLAEALAHITRRLGR